MKRCIVASTLLLCISSEPLADSNTHKGDTHTEDQCLATALYYEARGESLAGKKAVLEVIENRMSESGKSACSVVKQRGQFSWYRKRPIKSYTAQMKQMLTEVRESRKVLINERYKYFFSKRIRPGWSRKLACRPIGNHIFCKEKVENESRKPSTLH